MAVLLLESASSQAASITDASQTGLDLSTDFTLELCLKADSRLTSNGTRQTLMSKWNTGQNSYLWQWARDSSITRLEILVSDDGSNFNRVGWDINEPIDIWEHLAVTCDISEPVSVQFELFINGSSAGNGDVITNGSVTSIFNGTADFVVGAASALTQFYDGRIAQARIWNDIRTPSEILAGIDTDPAPGSEPNLVAYWKFDGDLLDETTNNNDLTGVNSPTFPEGACFDVNSDFGDDIEVGGYGSGPPSLPSYGGDYIETGAFGGEVSSPEPVGGDDMAQGSYGSGQWWISMDGDYIETGPPPPFEPPETVSVSSVEVLSKTTVLLTFNTNMANDSELSNPENYSLSLVSGSLESTILSVLTGTSEFTDQVVLNITPPNVGSVFSLDVVGGVQGADGSIVDPLREAVQFETRFTKMDSVLSHLTQVYSSEPGSNLRTLLHAITREDDKIGGSREDFLP